MRVSCWVVVACALGCSGKPSQDKLSSDALSYLPRDAQIVFGMDLTQFRSGPLAAIAKEQLANDRAYAAVARGCKVDPLAVMDRAVIGITSLRGVPEGVLVIKGREMPALLACIEKAEGAAQRDGEVITLDDAGGGQLALASADESTLVGVFGFSPTPREVRDVLAKTSSLAKVSAFMDLYRSIETNRASWLAAKGEVLGELDMEPAPRSIAGSLRITERIIIDVRIRFGSSRDATAALDNYGPTLESKQPDAARATIAQDGADVTLKIETSPALAHQLIGQLRDEGW